MVSMKIQNRLESLLLKKIEPIQLRKKRRVFGAVFESRNPSIYLGYE